MDYEFISLDLIEELKENFEEEIQNITNELGIRFFNIAQHAQEFEKIHKVVIIELCEEIDKGISANDEFRMHCDVLAKELDGIENLAKCIQLMRKNCEEIEKKLIRTA